MTLVEDKTFLCFAFAITDLVTLGILFLIKLVAIFRTVPPSLLSPRLCLFLLVDCLVKYGFYLI